LEVLKREDYGVVALVDINRLHDHEEINKGHLAELTEKIKQDGHLKEPIIVDKSTWVVLDGHHRFFALKNLGCKRIAALVVDYFNPNIQVKSWYPVVKTKRDIKAILKAISYADFNTVSVESKKVAEVLVESGQACLALIVRNDVEKYFVVKAPLEGGTAKKTFEDAMNAIREGLKTEGVCKELDYVCDETKLAALLANKEASLIIKIPHVTKEKVVERAASGRRLPPKTTRHIIPKREKYPVSLHILKQECPTEQLPMSYSD